MFQDFRFSCKVIELPVVYGSDDKSIRYYFYVRPDQDSWPKRIKVYGKFPANTEKPLEDHYAIGRRLLIGAVPAADIEPNEIGVETPVLVAYLKFSYTINRSKKFEEKERLMAQK